VGARVRWEPDSGRYSLTYAAYGITRTLGYIWPRDCGGYTWRRLGRENLNGIAGSVESAARMIGGLRPPGETHGAPTR
jgi:hypothetical protein